MTCQQYLDALLAGVADDAAAGTSGSGTAPAPLAEHERGCAACRERGASFRAALTGLANAPGEPPRGFSRGVMMKVAGAHAPWEPAVPSLVERITAWLLPRFGQLAAGAAFACVLVLTAVSFAPGKKSAAVELARLTGSSGAVGVTPAGENVTVAVPDGGYARLALGAVADATFTGSARATITGSRQIELTAGEARLDVHHEKVGPAGFRVSTPHCTVLVTGTEFSVVVKGDETQVTLFRGRVQVEGAERLTMEPGERAVATPVFLRKITTVAKPAWPMLPTSASAVAEPEPTRIERPGASLAVPSTGRAGDAPALGPKITPSGEPVRGTALPEVPSNANVHEPFHP